MSRVQLFFIGLVGALYFLTPLHANPLAFYGAYIEIPQGWQEIEQPTPNERYFLNEDTSATLNIAYYRSEELSSVNALAQHRVVSRFEGWITMLDRPAKPDELKRVQANDGRVTVYGRQLMLGPNKFKEDIVGEYYYFVSPNVGYVVSIETELGYWKEQQSIFRSIIDSFGIGNTPAPILRENPTLQTSTSWTTDSFGRSREGVLSNFNPEKPIKQHYKINLGTDDTGNPHSWVLSGNNLYIQFNKHLACIDTLSKKTGWIFQVPGSPSSPIWEYRGALYMVRQTLDGDAFLFAIQPDSGGIIFSENLGKNISFSVGSGKTIAFIQSGQQILFDIESHTTEKHGIATDRIFSFKKDRILTQDKRILSNTEPSWELGGIPQYILGEKDPRYITVQRQEETALEAISIKERRVLWHTSLGEYHLTQAPILHGDTLLVFVTDKENKRPQFFRFDTQTGAPLRQGSLPNAVDTSIPFGNGIYLHFQGPEQQTGWLAWDSPNARMLKDTTRWTDFIVTRHGTWALSVDKNILILSDI